jgi:hypothetical protein
MGRNVLKCSAETSRTELRRLSVGEHLTLHPALLLMHFSEKSKLLWVVTSRSSERKRYVSELLITKKLAQFQSVRRHNTEDRALQSRMWEPDILLFAEFVETIGL